VVGNMDLILYDTRNINKLVPYDGIRDLYHEVLHELPKIAKLTTARKTSIKRRWIEDLHTLDDWKRYFEIVSESAFLMGKSINGTRTFKANIDWLINESNMVKIIEGNYHED